MWSLIFFCFRSYAKVLRDSNKDNLLAFRLLSLWLSNKQKSDTVAEFLSTIPSHKFVPLLCQICAHLSDQCDSFADTVRGFVGERFNHLQRF